MTTRDAVRKVTISLPEELVEFADSRARELNTSRSRVISMALTAAKTSDVEQLAAEGYRFYCDEAGEFAEATRKAVAEAWTEIWLSNQDERISHGGQAQ